MTASGPGKYLVTLTLILGALTSAGCGACDTSGQEPLVFTDGKVSVDGSSYESTAANAEMLHFPSGRVYDLVHGLGVRPVSVHGYVSLKSQLTEDGDPYDPRYPNNVTETAGNEMVIEKWDDEVIRVRNDTCAEFYVRVVAFAGNTAPQVPGGSGGSSGNGGAGGSSNP